MSETKSAGWTDLRVEQIIGNLLRRGIIAAAVVVLVGAVLYLIHDGSKTADHQAFHGEPDDLRSPVGIVGRALALRGRGLIQLGLLLLIATPVARVIFSVYAFARQRDWTYVVITVIVLGVLLYSLLQGRPEG